MLSPTPTHEQNLENSISSSLYHFDLVSKIRDYRCEETRLSCFFCDFLSFYFVISYIFVYCIYICLFFEGVCRRFSGFLCRLEDSCLHLRRFLAYSLLFIFLIFYIYHHPHSSSSDIIPCLAISHHQPDHIFNYSLIICININRSRIRLWF